MDNLYIREFTLCCFLDEALTYRIRLDNYSDFMNHWGGEFLLAAGRRVFEFHDRIKDG